MEKQRIKVKKQGKRFLCTGILLIALFAVWTVLIQTVDVRIAGETKTNLGFATFNCWFHRLTGVHMQLYTLTDWLGLVPVFVCLLFGAIGFAQLIRRKSLRKVDPDLLLLGAYYILVVLGYLAFEMLPVNYRPVLIEGIAEASYPSSTTLLTLSVMPTLTFQTSRRLRSTEDETDSTSGKPAEKNGNLERMSEKSAEKTIRVLTILFSFFMVIGRLIAGVHWFTDIAGAVLLSAGLFCLYKGIVLLLCGDPVRLP